MSRPSPLLLAPALLLLACAPGIRAARHDTPLPPPARDSRAGARHPGAGPALVPRGATPQAKGRAPRELAVRRALEIASSHVGRRRIAVDGVSYGDDCAALVRAALAGAGRPLPSSARDAAGLAAHARAAGLLRTGAPRAGDLVFLADRPDGSPAHVGIVETVSDDGTVLVLHRAARGVARLRANAAQPWKARGEGGKWLNDVLVVGGSRVPAGRLVVGYASLL